MDAYGVSPSSSSINEKYDVFLSFRGEDTRNKFTSHLHDALERRQIETYIDEKGLERGDDITLALPEAIQKSKISIIIFSKDYASSSWCLRELEHILECRRQNKQMVIPIFYEVDPSHIRKQEGSYKESFLEHEVRFKDKMEMVQRWRAALTKSADLSGWDSQVTRPESELVKAVVDDVLRKLNRLPSGDIPQKDLIGIKEHIQEIEWLLSFGSLDIRIVGIWGLGGIGKTTIADLLFHKHHYQFDSYCFVANVREESKKIGLINLRNRLIHKLLKEETMNWGTPPSLPSHVKDRLHRIKVLIVLDDVNEAEQLQVLVGDHDLFGHGSRIIVTTRDAKVLKDIEADGTYEVRQLNYDEALELFKLKAFRVNSPIKDYMELSTEVVKYAGGVPLAIHILASHFRSVYPRGRGSWETTLNCLKEVSHDDIEKRLKISYDGLNKKEQAIFLDIACFFKGEHRELVENILNGCGFSASILINNLIDKSLITINYFSDTLWMHDLLQEMGWKIVQQQSEEQPGQQSRLWIAKDAYRVLKNNEGTQKIEGIFLDMAKIDKELHLSSDVFQKMSKLRLLKIYNTIIFDDSYDIKGNKVHLHQDLQSLPDTLRYLHWEGYPSKILPSNFDPQNLVEVNMPHNQLEQLANEVQDFDNLMSIDLRHSKSLIQFPDLSHAPKLENINMSNCNKLQSVPDRIFDVASLRNLTLQGFSNLNTLPMTITRNLVSLDLSSTGVTSLPSSIDSLINLSSLSLDNCTKLIDLPRSMNKLHSLKYLQLSCCSLLEEFPDLPLNIEDLDIRGTAIKQVPSSSIEGRSRLWYVKMVNCKSLQRLPSSIFKLRSLTWLSLCGCINLENLPEISEPVKSLRRLYLWRSGIRELPASIGNLIGIEELRVNDCENLESIPSTISNMTRLDGLYLFNCPKLKHFPTSADFLYWDLGILDLNNSDIIEIPTNIQKLSKLKRLLLKDCKNLCSLPELPLSLEDLDTSGCASLEVVSNSKRALTQEFWDYVHPTKDIKYIEHSLFCDCLRLDENQRHNIFVEFQLRVLRTATRFVCNEIRYLPRSIGVCFPGNEIPKWFEHQSEGSFIDIKHHSPQWHDSNFLGLVFCAVGSSYCDTGLLRLICEMNPKSNQGGNHKFIWGYDYWSTAEVYLPTTSNSGNVHMWYNRRDYRKCLDEEEASFVFSFQEWVRGGSERGIKYSTKCTVMKCGIHVLYRQDLEEFGLNFMNDQHVLENSDTNPEQPEFINADEPHPKRIKFDS